MQRALDNAAAPGPRVSPNPRVGAVLVANDGRVFDGATEPPGQRHAERVALDAAGAAAKGATVYTTLEPCDHTGRTGPCTEALIDAGVARVVIAVGDPDPLVAGQGIKRLESSGVDVTTEVLVDDASQQLRAYLHHRSRGLPYVVLKLASSLDGRTAAPDGTSQWITGAEARAHGHALRAASDAVLVGAGTVRSDDPSLTVRDAPGDDPLRVVLGRAPVGAKVHPCQEMSGELPGVLKELAAQGVLQLMVEGGATTAASFHAAGLVNEYHLYMAPALFGGDDGISLFAGPGAATMADVWRGSVASVAQLGDDLCVVVVPNP